MKTFGLYKKEKLCSVIAIEQLFRPGEAEFSALAYPLRAVVRRNDRRASDAPVQFLISIPKKRLHRAVDRVQMRRRVREAYRLSRHEYLPGAGVRLDVAFVYVADALMPYDKVERAVRRLLAAIAARYNESAV